MINIDEEKEDELNYHILVDRIFNSSVLMVKDVLDELLDNKEDIINFLDGLCEVWK